MNAYDRQAGTEPTPQQRARAFRNLCIGAAIGIVLGKAAEGVLDHDTLRNPLWVYGRYVSIALLAWIGWLVGIGKERIVSENVECLAIAIVMALILKYFLVEAYKIPTGSMQPTILGNENASIFDRVLVNKCAYLIDEPKRYDVIVFKYPLNRSQNYIKRCVGIGPEEITIENGNIYTAPALGDGKYGKRTIARKPADTREAVLKTLYPSALDGKTFATGFSTTSGKYHEDGRSVEFDGAGTFRFKKDGESVRDRYLDGYDPAWGIRDDRVLENQEEVGDLAIDFDFEPTDAAHELRIVIHSNSLDHRATLGIGEGKACTIESGIPATGSGTLTPGPFVSESAPAVLGATCDSPLRAGKRHHIEFYHVDQEIVLAIDGDVLLKTNYEIDAPLPETENKIEVRFDGGVELRDLRVRRDIHYLTANGGVSQSFDVPPGHLFAMGDNTQNSHDGRQWHALKRQLPNNGPVITLDSNQDMRAGVTDIYGEHFDYSQYQLTDAGVDNANYHFIPREFLLGKALAVFWPIVPHFRWKLIR